MVDSKIYAGKVIESLGVQCKRSTLLKDTNWSFCLGFSNPRSVNESCVNLFNGFFSLFCCELDFSSIITRDNC